MKDLLVFFIAVFAFFLCYVTIITVIASLLQFYFFEYFIICIKNCLKLMRNQLRSSAFCSSSRCMRAALIEIFSELVCSQVVIPFEVSIKYCPQNFHIICLISYFLFLFTMSLIVHFFYKIYKNLFFRLSFT